MRSLMLLLMFITCFAITIKAQDGTKWCGTGSNGVYPETGLLEKWPVDGPEILWHFDGLGQGFSSPVFAGGKG